MAFEDFHPGGMILSAGLGAADGFAAANDAKNGRTGWKRAAFGVQVASFLGGVVAEFMGAPAMYTEAAMGGSLLLAAREGTFRLTNPQAGGQPVEVQGYREEIGPEYDQGRITGGGVRSQGYLRRQPAGILG